MSHKLGGCCLVAGGLDHMFSLEPLLVSGLVVVGFLADLGRYLAARASRATLLLSS